MIHSYFKVNLFELQNIYATEGIGSFTFEGRTFEVHFTVTNSFTPITLSSNDYAIDCVEFSLSSDPDRPCSKF